MTDQNTITYSSQTNQNLQIPQVTTKDLFEIHLFVFILSLFLNLIIFIFTGVVLLMGFTSLVLGFIGINALKNDKYIKNGFLLGINTGISVVFSLVILIFLNVSMPMGIIYGILFFPFNCLFSIAGGYLSKKISWNSNPISITNNPEYLEKEKKDFGMIGLYVFSIIILILRTFTAYSGSLIEPLVGLITLWFVKRWNKRRKLIALSLWMLAFLMAYISFVNNKFSNNSF